MAAFLYKLGISAARNRKKVLFGSIAVLIIAVSIGLGMGIHLNGEITIPGTKSEEAMKVLKKEFSQGTGLEGGTIQVIFKAPEGQTLASKSTQNIIAKTLKSISKDSEIASIVSPYEAGTISYKKDIGYAVITYKSEALQVTDASKELVLKSVEQARNEGLQAELGGTVEFSELEIGGTSEIIGIIAAFMILAITFTSLLAAGLPILTAIIGLVIGVMSVIIASNFIEMASFSLILAIMLGLAVGIDYGLFIISRFRQNLVEGKDVEESIAHANATAGSAVIFAGLTVIIALAGLAVTGIPFITVMGVAGAFTVLVAVLISILVVPALLGMAGERIRPKSKAASIQNPSKDNAHSSRWGRIVTKYPLPIALAGVLLLGAISLPALHLQTGLPDKGSKSIDTTERRGYDLIAEGFGPGMNGPLAIILKAETTDNLQATFAKIGKELSKLPNVAMATPPVPNATGKIAMVTIIPGTEPKDEKTTDLVHLIRDKAAEFMQQDQVEVMVTGSTAVNIDITEKLNEALPKFAALIVGLALILLMMVFRSILVPIKAVIGYLLTLTATLGFVVFIVQDGNLAKLFDIPVAGPVLNFLPILTAGILFGLAMDYEVFLVSRMREEYNHSGNAKNAVLSGLKNSGSVVTAAGLIMIAVFASFIFVEDTMIKSMGLALAFGILFDAFIVRLTIVPAVMTLMGRSAWYLPKWLGRILPNIDVEGESIERVSELKKEIV
ncbi:MMPL family transporter [Paenibacillus sp. chi10]|uniref:MMPL family transporter n=1 Tax=Paenibacillus suaedae TaxID=3077233 RepID=A0AAJ2K056_9BACL|nr:MMPL family transporter [Paenibacillus sp. chi10]MDT8977709.1 MMPL family transporter [Paenibacillus sp. chi10]